ncbi:hypothetical protein [Caldicellulosiruptor morganii]|uniref:Glycerophosphoryl diester phosphodiesterase membrane domain-containing protein n=1 Tax=Caldicellulosiruptor morganii TaxID=1387555 RepID=A0ABY7BN83_9FIRM|nr:hypothetical protein [Caldicellulosiruptor morganii]WAM33772.1 hypothetical protein OTK00_002311 [Caldicellulosiruptor morganii]
MFKTFVKDSFFYTKRYYGYIFGLIVLSFLFAILSLVVLILAGLLLAMIMRVDISTLSILNDKDIFPFLSSRFIFFLIIMGILFVVWMWLAVAFIQYPLTKTFIEITRDREIVKRPFYIYFETMKEKNLMIALKMFGLGLLLMLILAPIFFVAIIALAKVSAVSNILVRAILIIIGLAGIVLSIYLLLRLLFSNLVLVDRDLPVLESIRESLKLTKGKLGFLIAAILYNAVVSIVVEIPVYIIDAINVSGTFQETAFYFVLTLISIIIYFLAFPYIMVIQYVMYNIVNEAINKGKSVIDNNNSYSYNETDRDSE